MEPEDQQTVKGFGIRLVIGSSISIFLLTTTFLAGAAYNRMDSMATSLTELKGIIGDAIKVQSDIPILKQQNSEHERRITYLEEYLRKHP